MIFALTLLVGIVSVVWQIADCKSGVILTAPKIWLLDSEEKVCVTSVDIPAPLTVRAELCTSDTGPTKGALLAQMHTTLNNPVECFEFPLKSELLKTNSGKDLNFKVEITNTATGYNFTDSHKVGLQKQGLLMFIQTDKPVYKPGQTVKFRILSVTPGLLPYMENIEVVYIEDPKGARMVQWTDVSVQKTEGLADFEMPLSTEPVQGRWKITTQSGSNKEERVFKVEEYVLPKFEIEVKPPSYVMSIDELVTGEVCAKYTYGEPVRGMMSLQACFKSGGYYTMNSQPNCVNFTAELDGCAPFSIDTSLIGMRSETTSYYSIQFQANVTERGTGVMLTSRMVDSTIETTQFKLNFKPFSSSYFKPGLTYHGKVSVTKPDNTPAVDETVQINVDDWTSDLHFSQNYTTNSQGEVEFGLPVPIKSTEVESLNIRAIMPEYVYDPEEYHWRWRPYTPQAYHQVKQWYSPSGSHIQISPIGGTTACGGYLEAEVSYTTDDNNAREFHFQVISGGDIVYSDIGLHAYDGIIEPAVMTTTAAETTTTTLPLVPEDELAEGPEISFAHDYVVYPFWQPPKIIPAPPPKSTVATFIHRVPVTSAMSGSAKLLVFYVLSDGEVVADSTDFSVAECVQNDVKLKFLDTQKYPGEATKLRLQANPGSLCSVGVVDKSVQLMGQDTQLTLRQVFDLLKAYDINEHDGPWTPDTYCQDKMELENDEDGRVPTSPPFFQIPQGQPMPRQKRSFFPGGGYHSNYVDSKQAFQQVGLFVLGDLTIETRPCQLAMGMRAGVLDSPMFALSDSSMEGSDGVSSKGVETRNFFPETWLWDLYTVSSKGVVTLPRELPHTITEWVGNAFCTNSRTGLGVSPPAIIRAFHPFFVSFTLPYSIIRGEKVNLPVTVFNYLTDCLVVELLFAKTHGVRVLLKDRRVQLCVCGQQSETHTYNVIAAEIGKVNVTVKARSRINNGICGNGLKMSTDIGARDAVTRQLLVEPEGREEERSFGSYICPKDGAVITDDVQLSLPEDAVRDSARAFINVIGDVMGPSLSDLDNLLSLPTGCGEQNMLKFAPNIFIMQYLTATNQLNGEIKDKATNFLITGYQRELTYRHPDGSYSAFGNRDPEGSMWLTAFVVKSFAQARPYIYIDEEHLHASIAWFKARQLENGCFPQVGKVIHKAMKGGLSDGGSEASLTAYVLVAMLEAGISRKDPAVVNAIRCLDDQILAEEDVYTKSLLAYAYSVYEINDGRYTEMVDVLLEKAVNQDGTTHWEVPRTPPPSQNPDGWTYIHHTSPADVEATAYALMAITSDNEGLVNKAMPIVRWLTAQRNPQGGFGSTQDTVVGLQALAAFAVKVYGDDLDLSVHVAGDDGHHEFAVDNNNSLVLQQSMVAAPNNLHYTISGKGCVFVQTNLKYNVYNMTRPGEQNAFEVNVTLQEVEDNSCRQRIIEVCAKYIGPGGVSNMAVITVKMVSGWMPNTNSVSMLLQDPKLMLKRFEIEKNLVNFYFDELLSESRCFLFQIDQDLEVDGANPGIVHVFDYYETSLAAMTQYKIFPSCGTENEAQFGLLADDIEEQQDGCPQCFLEVPELAVLRQYTCEAQHAYKGYIRKGSRRPLRVVSDLKTEGKLNYRVKYKLPAGCECESLEQLGSSRILVFTSNTEIVQSSGKAIYADLHLDGSSKVVPLASSALGRKLRTYIKRGRC